jgi:molecular chaperone HtpG
METLQFQAEVKQILDLMIHSLYSQREIFLRELISNAADALEKRRVESLESPGLANDGGAIRISSDKASRTISISDNGIGMSKAEVIKNIGTIAHSGTKSFLENAQKMKENPELIGQFGVGFYSAFIVADKVTLHTRKAGTNEGTVWQSTGDGTYSIDTLDRPEGAGTTITLHLKEFKDDETAEDFTDEWVIRRVIRKYSDFVEWPILMKVERKEPELDESGKEIEGKFTTTEKDETLNSRKALWRKPPTEVTPEEYSEFYKQVGRDWTDPLETIHYKAEGTNEFSSLLFIPGNVPFDYNQRDARMGPSLYVKKIFISDNCQDLTPLWLRFVRGVIDSEDLPLNVSREILQKDRRLAAINKAVTGKVIRHFENLMKKDREKWVKVWNLFGSTIKEGIATDSTHRESIEKIALFRSNTVEELTTLDEYVSRMKPEQKAIFYITGDNFEALKSSPYMERLNKKSYEVLLLTDAVDEWVTQHLNRYADKPVESITKEKLELDSEDEKKENEQLLKSKEAELKEITTSMQESLSEFVKEVRLSDRLVDSPVCLVSGSWDASARMERILESMGQKAPKSKRILEINPSHPIFQKMKSISAEQKKEWADILYNQALLTEGSPLKDPMKFAKQVANLMTSH